jgi:hypothetical protein
MSMELPSRPARKVAIADHIWDAFDDMAREMGSDRDGLINQAMYMFARLNGFLDGVDRTARNEGVAAASPPARASVQLLQPVDRPAENPVDSPPARPDVTPPRQEAERLRLTERESEAVGELQRAIQAVNGVAGHGPAGQQELLGDDNADGPGLGQGEERAEDPEVSADAVEPDSGGLFLITDSGEKRVAKERYVIGRGKHCDLVINSGKVSREHASIVQEGGDWYIEDLGSSNGTWFNKQRIKRRKIDNGDEYFVCSERICFALR